MTIDNRAAEQTDVLAELKQCAVRPEGHYTHYFTQLAIERIVRELTRLRAIEAAAQAVMWGLEGSPPPLLLVSAIALRTALAAKGQP